MWSWLVGSLVQRMSEADRSMPCSSDVGKIQAFAARSSGHEGGTSGSISRIVPLGIRTRTGKNHQWRSTPTPNRWSVTRGCPVPSGMGEGNNSPVGAGGATRLTGLNPGARLRKESRRTKRECGALGELSDYEKTESNGMLLFHARDGTISWELSLYRT
jgi:hypothetical protein